MENTNTLDHFPARIFRYHLELQQRPYELGMQNIENKRSDLDNNLADRQRRQNARGWRFGSLWGLGGGYGGYGGGYGGGEMGYRGADMEMGAGGYPGMVRN